VGYALDRIFADPTNHHPVALYGQAVSKLECRIYADSKARGVAFTAIAVATPVALAAAASTVAPSLTLAAATWASLGGTTLRRTGERMTDRLTSGDIDAARELVPWLCSRDPEALDADGIARATVESLAENTSDAVTGTLMWGAIAGAPGVVAHRAANTLDAMVGYRNARYRQFGWASARLDDVVGFFPARLTAVATVVAGPDRRSSIGSVATRRRQPPKSKRGRRGGKRCRRAGAAAGRRDGVSQRSGDAPGAWQWSEACGGRCAACRRAEQASTKHCCAQLRRSSSNCRMYPTSESAS